MIDDTANSVDIASVCHGVCQDSQDRRSGMKEQLLLIVKVFVKRGSPDTCALADEVRPKSGVPAFEQQLIKCLNDPSPRSSRSFIFRPPGHDVAPCFPDTQASLSVIV
jgi:hypothetical protein